MNLDFITTTSDYLTGKFGPLGPLYALGLLGVLLMAMTLPIMLRKRADPMDRLSTEKATKKKKKGKNDDAEQKLRFGGGSAKLDKYKTFLEPKDQTALTAMRLKLVQAGYRAPSAVRTYHFAQMALGIGGLFLGLVYALISSGDASVQATLLSIFVPAGAGYYMPSYWVERRRQTRMDALTDGFPDALDLMLVCVEAGQSMDQSIQRVAGELRAGFPELAEEFETVANEMKAGKDRVTVLRDLGERAGAQDISAFVTVLIQSASFGTSIAEALRVYAAEMRDKRVMRAEEKANKLPTKLTLGTMMFTLPPLLIILIGPSVYDIYLLLLEGK